MLGATAEGWQTHRTKPSWIGTTSLPSFSIISLLLSAVKAGTGGWGGIPTTSVLSRTNGRKQGHGWELGQQVSSQGVSMRPKNPMARRGQGLETGTWMASYIKDTSTKSRVEIWKLNASLWLC